MVDLEHGIEDLDHVGIVQILDVVNLGVGHACCLLNQDVCMGLDLLDHVEWVVVRQGEA